MSIKQVIPDLFTALGLFPASQAVARGDLLYYDKVNQVFKPLTLLASLGSEALDQAQVQPLFAGVAADVRLATETDAQAKRVYWPDGVYDADCPAQTFNVGDLVGPTWNGGTSLTTQFVTKVGSPDLAVGTVTQIYLTNTTTVRCRLTSRNWLGTFSPRAPGGTQAGGPLVLADQSQTLTVAQTANNALMNQAPSTPRTVTLPLETAALNQVVYFANLGASTTTFAGSGLAGTQAIRGNPVVPALKCAVLWCDGVAWYCHVSN